MLIVFDIDGTLVNCSHRLHHILKDKKDWESFYRGIPNDKPIEWVLNILYSIYADCNTHHSIVLATARNVKYKSETVDYFIKNNIFSPEQLDNALDMPSSIPLYMRGKNDLRPDVIVKSEMFDAIEHDYARKIDLAFEDRSRIVNMIRARGTPCFQVAEGDF